MSKNFKVSLGIDEDALASCVSCGLCLPHCPTYRVTQEETASPRGRIALMRQVEAAGVADDAFIGFMDACIQCRGCETACPSGVPFGPMMETTREALADQTSYQPRYRRLGYSVLGMPRLLALGSRLIAVLQRLRLIPSRLALPRIPLRQTKLKASGDDVWLFTGCIMDAWMRDTHAAVKRVVESTGAGVRLPGNEAGCCGALHVHAGLTLKAKKLANKVIEAFPGTNPILVDSAGCGAQLKDYGHLLGTTKAEAFSSRVFDVHEWLAENLDKLPKINSDEPAVIVQDPCHLRHVQRSHEAVRLVMNQYIGTIELDDDGLCCGAGGAYSSLHPETAAEVRTRKLESINRSGGTNVVSANPGCMLHLQQAGVSVQHPLELVDSIITRAMKRE